MGGVAKWLNEKGYEKKVRQNGTVSRFSAAFVKGILDNPIYMGKIAYGRRKNEKIEGSRNESHVVKQKNFNTYVCKHRKLVDGHTCSYRRHPNQDKINAEVEAIVKEFINQEAVSADECEIDYFANVAATRLSNEASGDLDIKKRDLERLQKQYEKVCATKNKLIERMDSLDILDANYDAKYDDYEKRLDKFYEQIKELEIKISELQDTINLMTIESDIYRVILEKYKRVINEGIYFYSDYEKKLFFSQCIERIDIFKDDKERRRVKYTFFFT